MVKILEGILDAGLLPYAYHCFRDRSRSKDIISPAQAVMVKLITVVYRYRPGTTRGAEGGTTADAAYFAAKGRMLAQRRLDSTTYALDAEHHLLHERRRALLTAYPPPTRTDLHALNFLFTEFRQHIVPQTCALIFLQGQIHVGRAGPEDFPLNLWDMERMYEGVYQFLEFFAVLCEDGGGAQGSAATGAGEATGGGAGGGEGGVINGWGKGILAEWEASCELVALLRELEGGGEKREGIVQLRYGKGAAIGGVPGAAAARRQALALQQQQQLQMQSQQLPPGPPLPSLPMQQRSLSADAAIPAVQTLQQKLGGGAVDRPFDLEGTVELPPLPATLPSMGGGHSIFEAETPLAYPEDMAGPAALAALGANGQIAGAVPGVVGGGAGGVVDQDEPSDF
ncbi:hypothetical protein LTR53_018111, partial [Teratosphaeriaceae sp. CCFEE 6253]